MNKCSHLFNISAIYDSHVNAPFIGAYNQKIPACKVVCWPSICMPLPIDEREQGIVMIYMTAHNRGAISPKIP